MITPAMATISRLNNDHLAQFWYVLGKPIIKYLK